MSVTNAQIMAATRAAHAAIKALDKEALAALARVYRAAIRTQGKV